MHEKALGVKWYEVIFRKSRLSALLVSPNKSFNQNRADILIDISFLRDDSYKQETLVCIISYNEIID